VRGAEAGAAYNHEKDIRGGNGNKSGEEDAREDAGQRGQNQGAGVQGLSPITAKGGNNYGRGVERGEGGPERGSCLKTGGIEGVRKRYIWHGEVWRSVQEQEDPHEVERRVGRARSRRRARRAGGAITCAEGFMDTRRLKKKLEGT